MTYRALPSGLKTSLENEDTYTYTHLIRFEKPRDASVTGKVSKRKRDYAYLTDGAYDIKWNDTSFKDENDNAHGEITYVANRVLNVGTVSETIEAKATSMRLELSSVALNTSLETTFTFTSTTITAGEDLLAAGFSVGDVIEFSASGENNDGSYVLITGFSNDNKTISYSYSSGTTITNSSTATTYTITYASEEVTFLTESKDSLAYSSYLNRNVSIFRAHVDPTTGAFKGEPFLLFKGIITNGSMTDNVVGKKNSVTWTMTSHWGDFVQVNGRLTSDHAHRALDQNGNPDYDAAEASGNIKYAEDLGFLHAENSVNVIATYQRPETRYKQKRRGGLAGAFGMKRLVEYEVMVDQDVDLRFNLQSKYLPVVYGVQKVAGFPIFAEADKDDPTKVYVAQAICEGPVQGILDIHIDNEPLVCSDKPDADVRGFAATDSNVRCYGRADKGSVLKGNGAISNQELSYLQDPQAYARAVYPGGTVFPTMPVFDTNNTLSSEVGGTGIIHEHKFSLDAPLQTTCIFHSGKENQSADSLLVKKAKAKEFKLQTEYYDDMPEDNYWGPKHQVLDTAYCVMDFTIAEGETTIPEYEFVVKGRSIDCHNYDFSYKGSGTASDFPLGATVTLHKSSDDSFVTGTESTSTVQIIDKFQILSNAYVDDNRFRFSSNPQVDEGVTHFYMKLGANKYYFAEAGAAPLDEASEPAEIVSKSFRNTTKLRSTTDSLTFTYDATNYVYKISGITTATAQFSLGSYVVFDAFYSNGNRMRGAGLPAAVFRVTDYTNGTITLANGISMFDNVVNAFGLTQQSAFGYFDIYTPDVVKLHADASSTDDQYNNQRIKIYKVSNGIPDSSSYQIIDYDGTNQLAKLGSYYYGQTFDDHPDSGSDFWFDIEGDVFLAAASAETSSEDMRVSTNPAMILLDYLTNKRYGRGLSLEDDIDLDSFKAAARLCDTRSNVTVQVRDSELTTTPTVGAVYKYPASGDIRFQGKIKSITSATVAGTDFKEIEFEEVIGKLAHRWADGREYNSDDVVYHNSVAFTAGSSGTMSASTRDSRITNNAFGDDSGDTKLNLTKVSGTGDTTVPLSLDFKLSSADAEPIQAHLGNPIIKKLSPNVNEGFIGTGYSLYDSDDCPYWIYLGWNQPDQREVTRHQCNMTVDTSQSVFANVNAMLQQFNGILRYAAGRYVCDVKTAAPEDSHFDTDYPIKDIQEADIIGQVQVKDSGAKNIFNTITANIVDPQNKFGARSITFVNSNYLKEDRGVKKTGNYNVPGISNYFNARINVKQRLDESRYGLTATFTLDSKGYLLLAGEIIRITYSRFGWDNKYFRIDSLNFAANGLIQVVATEHNDSAYLIENMADSTSSVVSGGSQGGVPTQKPEAPTLTGTLADAASDDRAGYIELNWTNGTYYSVQAHRTQVARAATNVTPAADASNVTIIAEPHQGTYIDNTDRDATNSSTSYYYWVRHLYSSDNGTLDKKTAWLSLGQGTALPQTETEIESGIEPNDGGITMPNSPTGEPQIKAGISTFDTGSTAGFFLGYDTDAYKFQVGDPSGDNLKWDGSALSVTGSQFTVTTSGGTEPSITGTTLGGAGILLKSDGDVLFGDSADKYLFFDASTGNLTLNGVAIDGATIGGGSTFDGNAKLIVQEDGTQESDAITTINVTTGLNLETSNGVATLSVDSTDSNTTYSISAHDSSNDAIIRLTGSDSTTDDVKLVAGSNITITPSGDDITIAATGGVSANDSTISFSTSSAGISLDTDASFTTNQSSNETITIDLADDVIVNASVSGQTLTLTKEDGNTVSLTNTNTDLSTDVTLAAVTGNYLSISGQEITSGTVPVSLGGTGSTSASAARTALGVDAAGTDNSTDVTLAGTPDYITISGQTITRNKINLTTDVTGDLPVADGGTGASTAAGARTNLGVDPAGTDNSTDVTLAGTPDYITISGQVITRNKINLTTDVTGDLPVADGGTGASTAAGARTNLGVDPAGTDNSTDVTLAGTPDYITISGQTITRNKINLTTDVTGDLPVADGGTGASTAAGARTNLGVDPAGTDNSTDVTLATVAGNYLSISGQEITAGTVPVSLGGTGSTSASAARTALGVDAAGTDNSTDVTLAGTPDYITISGQTITRNKINLTTDVTGDLPIADGGTGASDAATARTNLGVDPAGTDNSTDVTLTGTPDYITISGQTITRNKINLTTDVTGDLPIADGGTGASDASTARTNLGLGSLATLSSVGTSQIAADAVTGAKIADNAINSEHYTDGSIDTAHIADNQVTLAKMAGGTANNGIFYNASGDPVVQKVATSNIAADAVTYAKMQNVATANRVLGSTTANGVISEIQIATGMIASQAVTSAKIADSGVTSAKIAADAVTGAKIANNAIDSEHYTDGSIDNEHLSNGVISLDKIAIEEFPTVVWRTRFSTRDGSPDSNGEFQVYEVNFTNPADNGEAWNDITGIRIYETDADGLNINDLLDALVANQSYLRIKVSDTNSATYKVTSITDSGAYRQLALTYFAKTASGTYPNTGDVYVEFQVKTDAVVDGNLVVSGTVTADAIAANTITASEIAADTITASEIAAGTITASEISAGTITADEIAADAITANEIAADAITADSIAADAITADAIAADAITADAIAADAITADAIAADAITADAIAADAITADAIAADAITADAIAADAITADAVAANAITAEQLQISNTAEGTAGIFFNYNSGNPKITISDGTNVRVKIGYLG